MNTKLISILLLFASISAMAQEKRYMDGKGATTTAENAESYETIEFSSDSIHKTVRKYSMNEWMLSETVFLVNPLIRDGKSLWFNPDGSVHWYGNYENGKETGDSKTYYGNGIVKRDEVFSDGKLITGKCYDENGAEIPYFPMDKPPEYPGGMREVYKYVANNFHLKGTATGNIVLRFVVDIDGSITDITVVKSLNSRMDKEAIRVVSEMPKWIPGEQEGVKMRASFTLPIKIAK